jgi:hypothetical protein
MHRGHLPDYSRGDVIAQLAVWNRGDPVPRRFQRGVRPDPNHEIPLAAYRCAGCGFVELRAQPMQESSHG